MTNSEYTIPKDEYSMLKTLLHDALWCEGGHHKQRYLWEIASRLGITKDDVAEYVYPDEGIGP